MPAAISDAARRFLATVYPARRARAVAPAPDDLEGWQRWREESRAGSHDQRSLIHHFGCRVWATCARQVECLRITPRTVRRPDCLVIYVHGGGYTLHSAQSQLAAVIPLAHMAGIEVLSVDYTTAPQARFPGPLEQVASVYRSLLAAGHEPRRLLLFGDSAGGALAAATVLKLRDEGIDMPAGLLLWSPWSDITDTGDTYETLREADPACDYATVLHACALAYAEAELHRSPLVSPVYADFSAGFPPTLIQVGTREIFLSNSVRLYRALDEAGCSVELDVHEGMPHAFQITAYRHGFFEIPEVLTAVRKSAAFVARVLDGGRSV